MTKHDNVSLGGIMKATEFVKKFGLNTTENYADHCVNINDLKRIVESHELVERCGGLNSLKAWVKETKSKLSLATYFHCNKPLVLIQIEKAEQAIADVEACHEVN